MPAALNYITDRASTEYRELEEAHRKEYEARRKKFERYWQYYEGEMPPPLKIEADNYNDNILFAKVDQVADRCLSFLLGEGVTFNVGGEEKSPADQAVADLWQRNRGDILLHNLALTGIMSGHVFARLEPREGQPPRIVALNPAHCSAFWDVFDVERVLWYRLQYRSGDQGRRIDYVRASALPEAEPKSYQAAGEQEPWQEITFERGRGGVWEPVEENTLDWVPIVDWQNLPRPHAYYGADEVSKAVLLNDAVNFVISNYNRILKHHGNPKTIIIGADLDQIIGTAVGGVFAIGAGRDEGVDVFNLEMKSDLGAARELLSIVLREVWQSAHMVDPQTVRDAMGHLTNFGLRVLYQDALNRVATKRLLYQEGFEQIIQRAFLIMGQPMPAEVKTIWPDVLPEDAALIGAGLLKELEAGALDMQTYRDLRGYDHEQIKARLQEQRAGEDSLESRLLAAFERGA